MSNLNAALKSEIARIARKSLRAEADPFCERHCAIPQDTRCPDEACGNARCKRRKRGADQGASHGCRTARWRKRRPSFLAPRPGLEPGTYGLTGPIRTQVRCRWTPQDTRIHQPSEVRARLRDPFIAIAGKVRASQSPRELQSTMRDWAKRAYSSAS